MSMAVGVCELEVWDEYEFLGVRCVRVPVPGSIVPHCLSICCAWHDGFDLFADVFALGEV